MARLVRTLALALLALLQGCGGGEQSADDAANTPIVSRASVLMEPPTIGIGEVATAVVVVTTPPHHRLVPISVPEIPRVWILESIAQPTEKSARRWLHRSLVRMRPRETGAYVFPGTRVTIESEAGEQQTLEVQARVFEVVSVLPQFPDRTAPFGLQEPGLGSRPLGILWPALGGAALALMAVAALLGLRRRRERSAEAPAQQAAERESPSLWDWAQREIARAFEALEHEPRQAANLGSQLLRHYVESRFHTPTTAATTEELSAQKAPLAAHSHWPEFVRVLGRMDELRFRPAAPGEQAPRIRAALEDARGFLEHCSPGERRA